jgi:hypothetical protein
LGFTAMNATYEPARHSFWPGSNEKDALFAKMPMGRLRLGYISFMLSLYFPDLFLVKYVRIDSSRWYRVLSLCFSFPWIIMADLTNKLL